MTLADMIFSVEDEIAAAEAYISDPDADPLPEDWLRLGALRGRLNALWDRWCPDPED